MHSREGEIRSNPEAALDTSKRGALDRGDRDAARLARALALGRARAGRAHGTRDGEARARGDAAGDEFEDNDGLPVLTNTARGHCIAGMRREGCL